MKTSSNQEFYKFQKEYLDQNKIKYTFTVNNNSLKYDEFILLLKEKNRNFFEVFISSLKDANNELAGYFWECPSISQKTRFQNFEFITTKSERLTQLKQNYASFSEYFEDENNFNKEVVSFLNPKKDSLLSVPFLKSNSDNKKLNYKNITEFTKNAPINQQILFWKEVAVNLDNCITKEDNLFWLSTHGLGVPYLHVRIDTTPKYYSSGEYFNYQKKYSSSLTEIDSNSLSNRNEKTFLENGINKYFFGFSFLIIIISYIICFFNK